MKARTAAEYRVVCEFPDGYSAFDVGCSEAPHIASAADERLIFRTG